MRRIPLLCCLLALPLLAQAQTTPQAQTKPSCTSTGPSRTLSDTIWRTTAVYEGNDRSNNVLANYPDLVGISVWDACSKRYEFFSVDDGRSYAPNGGNGDFTISADGRELVLQPASGPAQRSRLEVLSPTEYTYSKRVPKNLKQGQPMVTVRVVHTPYRGDLKIPTSPKAAH